MISTLCANPCVDKTVFVDDFGYGKTNQVLDIREEVCGKGVTVALVGARLGLDTACICMLHDEDKIQIMESIGKYGIHIDFISCPGTIRVNTKVMDRSRGVITEFNESGLQVSSNTVQDFFDAAVRLAASSAYIVLTGSTPPGFPHEFYRHVIEEVNRSAPHCKAVLDAEGERLAQGLKAIPAIVKPNLYELELLCGRKLNSRDEILREALKLVKGGVELVAVSMGADGACLTDGNEAYYAPALQVEVKSTLGAGDSMLAGMLLGIEQKSRPEDILRYGVAAAAASVATDGTGLTDTALFQAFLPKIEIQRMPI